MESKATSVLTDFACRSQVTVRMSCFGLRKKAKPLPLDSKAASWSKKEDPAVYREDSAGDVVSCYLLFELTWSAVPVSDYFACYTRTTSQPKHFKLGPLRAQIVLEDC